MALPATDSFDRANGALGANWSLGWATIAGFTVVSNTAQLASVNDEGVNYWSADTFGDNQYAQCVISTIGGAYVGAGPAVRYSASGGYHAAYDQDTGAIRISRRSGGSNTNIASTSFSVSAGDTLRLEISGSNLTLYVNGTSRLTTSDSTHASGAGGIYGWHASPTIAVNNFEAGNLTAAAASIVIPRRPMAAHITR
jgi:hypothetical protein